MKKIALVTGGDSGEYEISLLTAENIMNQIDKTKYEAFLIHLKNNNWTYTHTDGQVVEVDRKDFSLTLNGQKITFDGVFVAIHGNPGENGRLEGYFDMIGMPYTGCGTLSSALTFNKYYCNVVVRAMGVPVAPSLHYFKGEPVDYQAVAEVCGYPCFVKPCESGSSVGVTKVHDETELAAAIEEAFRYDSQLMVEKMISGRELTCGVIRHDGKIRSLAVTEIVARREFYDYKSKYTSGLHDLITPADIPDELRNLISRFSENIYHELACKGVVRFDFIATPEGTPYFLEVNTIPGQTSQSIVPNQIRFAGMELSEVYSSLIEEALR
ncbi:MAG: D-alanine--D-alanine ligase [Bacteroidales bacterium]|nr:D-alanine--D-alanine ligase [Bacteroidales bacterium]